MESTDWISKISWQNLTGNKYSQYGEEIYLRYIFDNIGTTNKHLVDIGANDGKWLSNTRAFMEDGWTGLLIDGKEFPGVKKHFITKENVLFLLDKYKTPQEFDLLSIDIDGNDYWILEKILSVYRPRVIISEFNSEHTDCKTIKYDPNFVFKMDDYYGYTFKAGQKLAEKSGYKVIYQNSSLNMYYLRADLFTHEYTMNIKSDYHRWWGTKGDGEWVDL